MARIAYFSDDEAGTHCARLTCLGLSQLDGSTILALQEPVPVAGHATPPEGVSVVTLEDRANAFDLERLLLDAERRGADVVAALPLAYARDRVVRHQFEAAIAVGREPVSATRALRAAQYVATDPCGARGRAYDPVPVWFLAGTDQSVLATKARLSPACGPRLPFAARSLPMALPRMSPRSLDDMRAWRGDDAVLGTATLLAALALAIASDPTAAAIDAAAIAAMMASRQLPAERRLADRLVGLAEAYGRLAADDGPGRPESPGRQAARSRDRRRLTPRPPVSADAREARWARPPRAGCA
ncbi:hypothetical protein [Methylobacterium sp. 1030]|uniref:hypothetical protein n=1 Tax=Methylobacterium sp. 1030 TaxID=3156404 RepID=UPI00339A19DD